MVILYVHVYDIEHFIKTSGFDGSHAHQMHLGYQSVCLDTLTTHRVHYCINSLCKCCALN